MADYELQLPYHSMYKETTLLQDAGKVFFGVWTPPEITLDGDERKVRVEEKDRGSLDFLADEFLGTRDLFWAIAHVNKIDYPPDDVVPGIVLTIPKLERVLQALQGDTGGQ
jgi:hypothetical protein